MTSSNVEQPFENLLFTLSSQCADFVEQAGRSIVTINERQRCGASGIYWQSGIVVTVDQAVRREEDISITLANGQTVTATVVGRDSSTDLVVLRLPDAELPTELPTLSSSNMPLRVGHWVVAVGRSHESLSASFGVIGRLGGSWRSWQGGQIDQFIAPSLVSSFGQMGSALLDSRGQLIGINTSGPRHMTLTIPVATMQRVVDQLLQTGRVAQGYLGVGMQSVSISERLCQSLNLSNSEGVILLSVAPDSPADQAGFLIGDVLIALDAQPITDVDDVRLMLGAERVGQPLTATVLRGGAIIELTVTVGERSNPEDTDAEGTEGREWRRGRGGRGRGRWGGR